jgi:hypothetical protein
MAVDTEDMTYEQVVDDLDGDPVAHWALQGYTYKLEGAGAGGIKAKPAPKSSRNEPVPAVQVDGKGKFLRLSSLELEHGGRLVMTEPNGLKREVDVLGCVAAIPKSERKGYPFSFRLDTIMCGSASGANKFIIAVGSKNELIEFIAKLEHFGEMKPGQKMPPPKNESETLCIAELQELLASGVLTPASSIFSDDFDSHMSIADATTEHPDLGAALNRSYFSTVRYMSPERYAGDPGGPGAQVHIAKFRKMVRSEDIDDDTMVMGGDMSVWTPLGQVRSKFGLADYMPGGGDDGVDGGGLDREASEATKAKIANAMQNSGKAKGMMKFKMFFGMTSELRAKEKKRKDMKVAQNKARKDHLKNSMKGAKAVNAFAGGKVSKKFSLDGLMKTPARNVANLSAFNGFLQLQGGFFKKFQKRWVALVEVDKSGSPLDSKAMKLGFKRCVLFYDDIKAKKPVGCVPSDEAGKFSFVSKLPKMDKKEKKLHPQVFGLQDGKDPWILSADGAGSKGKWMTHLMQGLTKPETEKPAEKAVAAKETPKKETPKKLEKNVAIANIQASQVTAEELALTAAGERAGGENWSPELGGGKSLSGVAMIRMFEKQLLSKKIEQRLVDRAQAARGRLMSKAAQARKKAAAAQAQAAPAGSSSPDSAAAVNEMMGSSGALTAMEGVTFDEVFQLVRRPLSSVNWMLVLPDPAEPTVVAAGGGSIPEMAGYLPPDNVLYAYVRLGFGSGDFRRTKWMFFRWSGEDTPAMQRGRANAVEEPMSMVLNPHHISLSASDAWEAETDTILEQIRTKIVSDDLDGSTYSRASFEAALADERELLAQASEKPLGQALDLAAEIKEELKEGAEEKLAALLPDAAHESEEEPEPEPEPDYDSDGEDHPYFMQHLRARPEEEGIGMDSDATAKVVVDLGYGSTKFGVAGEEDPSVIKNIVYDDTVRDYKYMVERKQLEMQAVDWESIEKMWERIFEEELEVDGANVNLSCTVSPFGAKSYGENMAELLFETFDVAGLYFSLPSILSLYAKGKTTGLVVDSGECVTSCIPVIDGFVVQSAVQTLPFGGRDITTYLQRGLATGAVVGFESMTMAKVEVVRQMKEESCYCGPPREEGAEKVYTMPDGRKISAADPGTPAADYTHTSAHASLRSRTSTHHAA